MQHLQDVMNGQPCSQHLACPVQPGDNESEESESDAFLTSAMEEAESNKAEEGEPFSSEKFESALTDAFNRTDEEFGKADNAALVGTTAVVALVGSRQLYVANCGEYDETPFDLPEPFLPICSTVLNAVQIGGRDVEMQPICNLL